MPAPMTATFFLRKKPPSHTAHQLIPLPRRASSPGMPSSLRRTPFAMMTVFAVMLSVSVVTVKTPSAFVSPVTSA